MTEVEARPDARYAAWDALHHTIDNLDFAGGAFADKVTALQLAGGHLYADNGETFPTKADEARDLVVMERLIDHYAYWVDAIVADLTKMREQTALCRELNEQREVDQ